VSEANRRELAKLLGMIANGVDGVSFLTTSEVGQLYRRGCSLRSFGGRTILRVCAEDADLSEAAGIIQSARSVADGAEHPVRQGMKQGVYIALK